MARLRSAPSVPATQTATTRKALNDKTNVTRSPAHVYEDDGNTEGLVKEAKSRRGRKAKGTQRSDDPVMAGALGKRRVDALASETAAPSTDELARSDGPPPPTAKPNKRPPRATRKPVQSQADQAVLEGLKKRMEEAARKEGGRAAAVVAEKPAKPTRSTNSHAQVDDADGDTVAVAAREHSDFDIPVSPPPPGKLTSFKRTSLLAQPSSVLRPQPTPAMDTSVLKNFRRRPRQPSMLALVQQRLATAQPSMIEAQPAAEDPTLFDFEASDQDEIEDDFAPDAEGTPLKLTQRGRKSVGGSDKKQAKPSPARNATTSRKRRSQEIETSSGALESLRAKRRRSIVSAAPVNSPRKPNEEHEIIEVSSALPSSSTVSATEPTPEPRITSEVQVLNSQQASPSTAPPLNEVENSGDELYRDDFAVPSTEQQQQQLHQDQDATNDDGLGLDDVVPNATIAEPASSSPASSFPTATQADPLTQVSPPPPVKRRPPKQKAKPLTTSALQSLLPKRRQPLQPRHRKSEYDFTLDSEVEADREAIDESDEEEEEEEEEVPTTSHRRQQPKSKPGTKNSATAAKTSKPRKPTAPPPPSSKKGRRKSVTQKQPTKTYGRTARTNSDKEKDDEGGFAARDEDDTTELSHAEGVEPELIMSAELEAAKRKFAEIDQWEMDFESLGDEEHRSSSLSWR